MIKDKKNNKIDDRKSDLILNNSLLEAAFEATTDGILIVDNKGKITKFNKKFVSMWHIPNKILKSKNDKYALAFVLNQLVNPKQFTDKVKELYHHPKKESFDILNFKDGRTFERYSIPQKIKNIKIVGRVWSFRDVTKEKKEVEELSQSEERFKNIFKYSAAGISLITIGGHLIDVNDEFCKIIGYSRKELTNSRFIDITHKDDVSKSNKFFQKILSGKIKHVYFKKRYIHKNGSIVWVNLSLSLVRDTQGCPLYFITHIQDITQNKKIEDSLEESEEKYRRLFESSKDSILILNENNGKIIDVNQYINELLGYSREELIGKIIYEIDPFRDVLVDKKKIKELKEKGYIRFDNLPLKSKSGKIKYVEFISNVYSAGDDKFIQCNLRDLTERRELEEAKIGFLSITSHQLRTPLSITKWILDAIIHDDELTPKQMKRFNDLVISNDRLIVLVNDLLNVSRIETGKLVVNKINIDLEKLINELIKSLKTLTERKNKHIIMTNQADIKNVYCDPILIHEILENLFTNALNYSTESSTEIKISVLDRNDDYLISVHNEGFIDSEAAEKINNFGKFVRGDISQSIEPAGSGLGLYITKKMIEVSGGTIWFESNVNKGTTFYVTIIKNKVKN